MTQERRRAWLTSAIRCATSLTKVSAGLPLTMDVSMTKGIKTTIAVAVDPASVYCTPAWTYDRATVHGAWTRGIPRKISTSLPWHLITLFHGQWDTANVADLLSLLYLVCPPEAWRQDRPRCPCRHSREVVYTAPSYIGEVLQQCGSLHCPIKVLQRWTLLSWLPILSRDVVQQTLAITVTTVDEVVPGSTTFCEANAFLVPLVRPTISYFERLTSSPRCL